MPDLPMVHLRRFTLATRPSKPYTTMSGSLKEQPRCNSTVLSVAVAVPLDSLCKYLRVYTEKQ